VAQRKNGAARHQCDILGTSGQVGQIGKRIKDLPGIAKHGVKQRDVAYPYCSEVVSIDGFHQFCLAAQYLHVSFVEAQRQEDSDGQMIGREHASISGMRRKRGR